MYREFCIQYFSEITAPWNLKFYTNIEYEYVLLYYVRENQFPDAYHSPYLFFFSPINFCVTDFSAPMRATVFKLCIHLQRLEVYCVKENRDICEICVKQFSGTTAPRIFKFNTVIGYD